MSSTKQEASRAATDEFDDKVVSAIGEAFNNVAIHGYRGRQPGNVELELEALRDGVRIRLLDTGAGFEPSDEPAPNLASLPESHMGLYIIRACVDQVSYERGKPPSVPNVLTLTKRYVRHERDVAER